MSVTEIDREGENNVGRQTWTVVACLRIDRLINMTQGSEVWSLAAPSATEHA